MNKNDIRKYLGLRDSLVREKSLLEERLQQINEALGNAPAPSSSMPSPVQPSTRGRAAGGGLSLRQAVLQATANNPLSKQEILSEVARLGYRFATKNPMNSLGVILYGKNPRFKNDDGKFSPKGGAGAASQPAARGGTQPSSGGAFVRKRRQMSPEARERIAAAQRARWAKSRSGK